MVLIKTHGNSVHHDLGSGGKTPLASKDSVGAKLLLIFFGICETKFKVKPPCSDIDWTDLQEMMLGNE
jgi:hypothetical protein